MAPAKTGESFDQSATIALLPPVPQGMLVSAPIVLTGGKKKAAVSAAGAGVGGGTGGRLVAMAVGALGAALAVAV